MSIVKNAQIELDLGELKGQAFSEVLDEVFNKFLAEFIAGLHVFG